MLISQFFKNQDVFITGGTGFIGKALVEKLLRSCTTVGRVFLLLRAKKGKSINERLKALLSEPLFNRLRREQPNALQKVFAISGDCVELGLGIAAEDLDRLANVSVIFHSAASVRFDDPLRKAILLNTRGTYELIKIAETLKELRVFVHISTTYCNPYELIVDEKLYPPYADWRVAIKLAETYDEDTLNILDKKFGDNQPNTYTFTKSLSEQIIHDHRDKLPVLIFRPSIVICSFEEPEPGWVDNFNGPVGMLIACGLGIMRSSYGDPDIISDYVPVDIVTRSLIVAAYKKGLETLRGDEKEEDLEVFNCASAQLPTSQLTAGEVVEIGKQNVLKNPFEKTLWVPGGGITRCWYWNFIKLLTLHIGMALLVDTGLRLANKKPMLLRLQRRIYEATLALRYFMMTSWVFKNTRFLALDEVIPKSEIDKFGFLKFIEAFDANQFFVNALKGAKVHLLKELPESSKRARRRLEIYKFLHYFIQLTGSLFIIRCLLRFLYFYFF